MSNTMRSLPTLETLRARRKDILALAERYGVSNVQVVGSVARSQATPDSDVDLLITTPEKCSVFDLVSLWLDMREALGLNVSLIPDSAENQGFVQSVMDDAVSL